MKIRYILMVVLLVLSGCDERQDVQHNRKHYEDLVGLRSKLVNSIEYCVIKSGDYKNFRLWAKIPMSKEDAERYSRELLLGPNPFGRGFMNPPEPPLPFWDLGLRDVEQVGCAANGNLRPGLMLAYWRSGHLYLYKDGLPGANDASAKVLNERK